MRGCSNCRHYVSKLGDKVNGYGEFEIYRKCQRDQVQTLHDWWNENGHKPIFKIDSNLDCHEYHETTQLLMDMNDKLDELEAFLKRKL